MTFGLPVSTLIAFLLVLARTGGFVAFLPLPAFRSAPDSVKAGLVLAITIALFPVWPVLANDVPSIGQLTAWALCEAGFGLAAGLGVSFLMEGFQVAAQLVGLQAGYGYASTIDPSSEAGSGVLQLVMMLFTGLLVFVLGLDHQLIRLLGATFEKFPAGSWHPPAASLDGLVALSGSMFSIGLRVAFPVIALLMLIDFALALLGRVQQQLQLLSLAFPAKMAAGLVILAALSPLIPKMFGADAERTLAVLWRGLAN